MINSIKLTNYRKHASLEIALTKGLNVLRAPTEGGKTTVLEAMAYAMFGSAALPQKLEEVVTYGVPLSKLRVDMTFTYLGVDYTLYRGKSGAELNFAGQKIVGQSEVTKCMEQLLGCNAKLAGNLMIAAQQDLRGALNEGPTGAGKIIEALADFDLFDRLIDLIQTKLPYGSTDSVEGRIRLLTEQSEPPEPEDLAPLQKAVGEAEKALQHTQGEVADTQAKLDDLDVALANQILADEKRLQGAIAARVSKIEQLEALLNRPALEAPDEAEIERLRALVEKEKNVASALAVKADLVRLPESGQWDQDLASLEEEIAKNESEILALNKRKEAAQAMVQDADVARIRAQNDYKSKLQQLESQLIKEETCALCGKDLKDVPEVAAINNPLSKQIKLLKDAQPGIEADLQEKVEKWQGDLTDVKATLAGREVYRSDLQAVLKDHAKVETVLARAGDNVKIDQSVVPWKWEWVGPEKGTDSAPALKLLENEKQAATEDAARRSEREVQLRALAAEQVKDGQALGDLPVADAKETLQLAEGHAGHLKTLQGTLEQRRSAVNSARMALTSAQATAEAAAKQAAQAKVQLAAAVAELKEIESNNTLVKKLRAARPQINDKLWNMVLAAVSKYFSQMRGINCTVRRSDGQFKADNEPVASLSGSTKDILGLAIRAALCRTFLPLVPFLVLDEPAAACDDGRELAMLGLLSTLGFEQVLMVTHSNLAEVGADNLIHI